MMQIQALAVAVPMVWFDGLDGQEDELTNVKSGKLDPSTDDEDDGEELIRPDHGAAAFEHGDESASNGEALKKYPGFQ